MAISVPLGKKPREGWYRDAACTGWYELFDENEDGDYPYYDDAVAFCALCPVKEDCRIAGQFETSGIWGGIAK